MEGHLFAGVPVSDFERAVAWYTRLYGVPESFRAHESEYIWTLAEDRSVYVLLKPESAGHGLVTVMLDDLDGFAEAAAARGIEPTTSEDYGGGVRKLVYRDPDGNELGFGSVPGD
ncbi:VOC family protein [Nocardioides sp. GXQ0305]|uniref:VOC family protein n=1 Tax=Nocardioides sp. GXQ0305 TaxID=3423912 RepID=UPI003D7D103D